MKGAVSANRMESHVKALELELAWCCRVMDARFEQYFAADEDPKSRIDIRDQTPPDLSGDPSEYARVVDEWKMGFDERFILMLAMVPHLRPQALDLFYLQNQTLGRSYTEFGGKPGKAHTGFLPTCDSAAFVLAGRDLRRRLSVLGMFDEEHFLIKQGLIRVDHQSGGEPFGSAPMGIGGEYLSRFTLGQRQKPDYNSGFPAKLITSKLSWNDLVLGPEVMEEIEHMCTWLRHGRVLMQDWGLQKNVKPGYRSLFYGPPGTGKTLTATLIGASVGVDVYRIDLSMVVSKFIGETEKNLKSVFDQAENKDWILFFDEADALFGKRTLTSSSNDRHANQQISYLLQRIEDFPGVVILATNLKTNIDEAFARRFQSTIFFPMPDVRQRIRLWQNQFPRPERLDADVRIAELAEKFELTGGALTNVARYGALRALRKNRDKISQQDLIEGVRKELMKEGRTL
jgi:hypothetical protein